MVGYKHSPGEEETDPIFQSLETPAQGTAALKIKRVTGKFPWEILDQLCSETKWTTKLLEKFVEVINKCFPGGKLGKEDALEAAGVSTPQHIWDHFETTLDKAVSILRQTQESCVVYKREINNVTNDLENLMISVHSTEAKVKEVDNQIKVLKDSFTSERKIECIITLTTKARDQDGRAFRDFKFPVTAVISPFDSGVDPD
ncbi:hypothetical protein FVEN_g12040 [Fusarium venenatum]|uniref:Uncharacterized protein n=1 Tax=Fusarium venenatum TaxID=56646 RepID=A0A2L2SWZ4_9HYPO|nr:uncharacterized protein FVRRES_06780 [Fusarium venenatum]KAG8349784.1 hypothetical protein FVEN_g12040 [Fusarium venenatum]KAH6993750.1 hypothetical protein EDB82DRAFT_536692 [Fusarium venenatum]CEI62344.1 unnamed protein product [Fusarium venenatum]